MYLRQTTLSSESWGQDESIMKRMVINAKDTKLACTISYLLVSLSPAYGATSQPSYKNRHLTNSAGETETNKQTKNRCIMMYTRSHCTLGDQ